MGAADFTVGETVWVRVCERGETAGQTNSRGARQLNLITEVFLQANTSLLFSNQMILLTMYFFFFLKNSFLFVLIVFRCIASVNVCHKNKASSQ